MNNQHLSKWAMLFFALCNESLTVCWTTVESAVFSRILEAHNISVLKIVFVGRGKIKMFCEIVISLLVIIFWMNRNTFLQCITRHMNLNFFNEWLNLLNILMVYYCIVVHLCQRRIFYICLCTWCFSLGAALKLYYNCIAFQ